MSLWHTIYDGRMFRNETMLWIPCLLLSEELRSDRILLFTIPRFIVYCVSGKLGQGLNAELEPNNRVSNVLKKQIYAANMW